MTIKRKILLTVDGSDQALEAVHYMSNLVKPETTAIVLFYVGSGFPEVFWDLNRNPLYRTKKTKVMGWLADQQLVIGEFNEKALKILADAGFAKENVNIKTQTQKTDVLKDIVQESYQDYHAVVMGKTGLSRLKDLFVGSMAHKLAIKIRHIPVGIVGGRPVPGKILIALDESIEAMRAVSCIGTLVSGGNCRINLCHCLRPADMATPAEKGPDGNLRDQDWIQYNENRFKPYMEEATGRLVEAGIDAGRISREFLFVKGNTIRKITETALNGEFGTVVVGRREMTSFLEEHLRGRFGETLIRSLENIAVWVVH